MASAPAPLRFRGDRSNPNYPAVLHLLRTYAAHLETGLSETDGEDADVHWGRPTESPAHACLILPARPRLEAALECAWTRGGFPVPIGVPLGLAAPGSQAPGIEAAGAEILDACGPGVLERRGAVVRADWDLLSFCADILFKRADFLPRYREASREGRFRDLPDAALGLDREPWVDRWMFRLLGSLPRFRAAVEELPARARLWLTHDLDNLAKWRLRSVAGQLLRTPWEAARGRFGLLRRNYGEMLARALGGRDPFDTMERVLALEGARKSACFFLANGRDHLFHRYDLARPRFRRVLEACVRADRDVGLHGQVHFISDAERIRAEIGKLAGLSGSPVLLNRQHYLRWDAERTLAGLEAAGVRVDATLGYNDRPGFRLGTSWPFLWFDCATDRPTGILEAPLILGEFQFYDPADFDGEAARAVVKDYLEKSCRQGGVFTVLFHNEYFYEAQFPGHGRLYSDMLAWADARGLPDFDPLGTHARYAGRDGQG